MDDDKAAAAFLDIDARFKHLDIFATSLDLTVQGMLSKTGKELDMLPDELRAATQTHIAMVQQAAQFLRAVATHCDENKMEFLEAIAPTTIPNIEAALISGVDLHNSLYGVPSGTQ